MSNAYRGLTKIAWGYVFLHFNLNLGTLNVLPNWAGYLLFFSAIQLLGEDLRDLPLLKPFCILLGTAQAIDWLAVLVTGETVLERFFLLNILVTCINLYFHFQLLTDLILLAEGQGVSGMHLRMCRNVNVVLGTLMALTLPWSDWGVPGLAAVVLMLVLRIIITVILIWQLFQLRKVFP